MDMLENILENSPSLILRVFTLIMGSVVLYLLIRFAVAPKFLRLFRQIKGVSIPVERVYQPLSVLGIPILILLVKPYLALPENTMSGMEHFLQIWLIVGFTWLAMRVLGLIQQVILGQYRIDVKDNLKARQINTQLLVIHRVLSAIIILVALSAILLSFEKARDIGLSLLASAGIAGIIIGLAAQRSLATLFAGIQLAITQPIRIDDVVIVENEWGRIEEITLTFVVVRIWDQRRLVVPITYFIERPFQNWTRNHADLLGSIYLYVDYKMPLKQLRSELERIVKDSAYWDGRLAQIQVTNTTEKSVELRALVSAENSSNAWDLRCLVREGLLIYLQQNFPESLPRIRLDRENIEDASQPLKI
ncbi:MAG: mechanosensitive ion channel [Candidatus Marinimicrobia bacterium]|nr:mechanosensitive ion channel [Candidatus Neomarinimicrobiota bacterium]